MQAIGASELIINDRGAIYHLNVRPEEIADTIITVGDPERVAEVSKYFDRIEHKLSHREFITHTGYIGNKRISVLSTGIGPDNIDIALNEIDALVNIDFLSRTIKEEKKSVSIIRMGTCGSLQGEVGVNELVAGTHGLGIDNVLHFYTQENNEEKKPIDILYNYTINYIDINNICNILEYINHIVCFLKKIVNNNYYNEIYLSIFYFLFLFNIRYGHFIINII